MAMVLQISTKHNKYFVGDQYIIIRNCPLHSGFLALRFFVVVLKNCNNKFLSIFPNLSLSSSFFFFFFFFGVFLWHLEVHRVGVKSELWPLAQP